ncbi:MAG TPA: response regulator transcription factor [Candidatus Ruania gallistercoris]|uniref:Response regulator transcription factor n=1 Tax=Candidatus Ruania gallistercoris TaxID=2838746 RepID=A0A9D2EC41_9MICO|nr:response regulator transcription factor [Candidatus Ruania gallistercoris]
MTIRVALVDDQSLVRSGFAMVLSVEEDIEVIGQASDGAEAVALIEAERPDVVLMDVQMPVLDGIEATRQVVADDLAKVIILTTFDRDDYLFAALQAGASGFLLKNADPEELVGAIHAVADGHALLAPEMTVKVIARLAEGERSDATGSAPGPATGAPPVVEAPIDPLTSRELDVLALLAEGMSNAEIATTLFVGEATVKTHVSHVLAKIGARDRVQAVVYAHRAGLTRSTPR